MAIRRILRIRGDVYSLAKEAPFASEDELHQAIAKHPEVLRQTSWDSARS